WSWCRRSACRTTCRPRSAKGRLRPRERLLGRHQMAFAGGDGLVEDLAHGIEAGTALRRFALAAKHLLATGRAGTGRCADVVVADTVADADDHAGPVISNDNANNSQAGTYAAGRSKSSANANGSQDCERLDTSALPAAE